MKYRNVPIQALMFTAAMAMAAFATPPAESPYSIPQPPFYGQVRLRTEFDGKAMKDTAANKALNTTQLRTRLGFVATPSEKVEIKVEFQDVRFIGSEPNNPATSATAAQTASTGNAKGVDLIQGYVAVQEGPVKVALGRQKMTLGGGRYMSTLEWSPTSRAFDGASGNWSQGAGDLTAFYFLVRDTSTATINDRLSLSGLHYDYKFGDNLTADAAVFYDQSRLGNIYTGDALKQYDFTYLDERVLGKFGLFTFEEEFIWQAGMARDTSAARKHLSSAAFQGAVRAGVAFPKFKANVGLDVMSGDSNATDGTTHLYHANYYFAHAYFGWMDYFVANPKFGVMDYRADVDAMLLDMGGRTVSLKGQYHYFMPQMAPKANQHPYGQEVDAELHFGLYPKSNIVLGATAFFGGPSAYLLPGAKLAKGQKDQPGYFFYVMPMFNF